MPINTTILPLSPRTNPIKILRNIGAVVIGLVIGSIVTLFLIKLNGTVISLPEGMNPDDMASLQANNGKFTLLTYLVVFLTHSFGTAAGAIVAGATAVKNKAILCT
ncbi:MAG: hypothetical protein ACJARP_001546 [Vicingaceae bacterium]